MVPEDKEVRPFGDNCFGTETGHYVSLYVTGNRPINMVYGIRRKPDETVIVEIHRCRCTRKTA
jgi:hypothetical protein